MKLRSYQLDCRAAVLEQWQEVCATLAVMPTGCGKTILLADIIKNIFPRRSMVIAHRKELVWQAKNRIKEVTGMEVEVEMGEYEASADGSLFHKSPAVVSTIQTHNAGGDGGGRLGKFNPMDFGLLVIDEAHHATSPSYRRIIDYYRTNPRLRILGVTATPDRADEEALGQIFDSVAFEYEILDAIHDGWLVDINWMSTFIHGLDWSGVNTAAGGDFNEVELAEVMEDEDILHKIVSSTLQAIGEKRTLVFTVSVEQARLMAGIFNRHRAGIASWVCAKTDEDVRRRVNSDFQTGKIQVVCNCGIYTEGYDNAGIECIVMARPTKSRALCAQMCGRGTRPHGSIAHRLNNIENASARRDLITDSIKPSCLILDFAGNYGKHKLVTPADVLGGKISDRLLESVNEIVKNEQKPRPLAELIDEEEEKFEQTERRRIEEEARRAKIVAKAHFTLQKIDPFDILQVQPVRERGWDKDRQLTDKMKDFLRKRGIDPDNLTFAAGRQIIGEIIHRHENNLCTFKQAKLLKKYGLDSDVSFEEANRLIDRIAKNNWRVPVDMKQAEVKITMPGENGGRVPIYVGSPNDIDDNVPF